MAEPLPEARLNDLLREVDWRFLLRGEGAPRTVDLRGGAPSEALGLVAAEAPGVGGEADLVVLGFPTGARLRAARARLREGGELACIWRGRRPLAVRRARARLRRAGFAGAHFYWPGPERAGAPELWLPLGSPGAGEQLLSQRPVHSRRGAALRLLQRIALRWGAVTPVCAIAHLPGSAVGPPREGDAIAASLPSPEPWLLLTGGSESDNKVVGLPLAAGPEPELVVKFARGAKAAAALEREVEVLRRLEDERPGLTGVPWVRAVGRRSGGRAVVQDAMHGKALGTGLRAAGFAAAGPAMTGWLIALAGDPQPQPASAWSQRLLFDPLDELAASFGDAVPAGLPGRARSALAGLRELPLCWEHRDLGPWNVVLGRHGEQAVIDWEDAEPRGLPGLDLVYFLATSALLAEGALDDPDDAGRLLAAYGRLLDPGTDTGRVFAACVAEYRGRLGIDAGDFQRLRLACWIVQALIACRRQPQGSYFLRLAEEELRRLEGSD